MSESSGISHSSAHLESIKGQLRAALLKKKRGEARHLLGQLISLTNGDQGQENLKSLLDAVSAEVKGYTKASGPVRDRLVSGTSLSSIQAELDTALPHWRAFVNDFPELLLAKEGLAPQEDPALKIRIKELEKKIAKGSVAKVVLEWDELGRPDSAASGALVQVLDAVAELENHIDRQEWLAAKAVLTEARSLLESEEGASFQPGYGDYLKAAEDRLRWEILLKKTSSSKDLKGRERQNLLVELSRAESDVNFRLRDTPSLNEIHERLKEAIEDLEVIRVEPNDEGTFLRVLAVTLLVVVLALIAAWLYFRSSALGDSSAGEPAGTRIPIHEEQVTPFFCCTPRHDRINTPNNTYYGIYS